MKEQRGEFEGADYNPYIRATEQRGHLGMTSAVKDWLTGRQVHLLSKGEVMLYYILRWRDDVIDVREQYPLPIDKTEPLADRYGLRHPRLKGILTPLTTDLVVTLRNGQMEAYSVKFSRKAFHKSERQEKNVFLQKIYWDEADVRFRQVYTDEMNRGLFENIRRVVAYWNPEEVTDKVSLLMHYVAHKQIQIDMETKIIDMVSFIKIADRLISDNNYLSFMSDRQRKKRIASGCLI